ncbi:MAG TPA: ABC transporter substrate-binding protein [Alphaproteobacteria bacterium]|nr:ABC transporter substrate-binding protein [Alphaproteobacteria bacterium]
MTSMKCCEKTQADTDLGSALDPVLDRRTAMKGLAGVAVGLAATASGAAYAQSKKLRLAFCGQLLCVVPYEVTRDRGHFREEGLDLELVYTRGGSQAMQALIGGAVDYAGTAFDVALEAFANGANIRRIASTGRLPLFALAVGPKAKDSIKSLKDLEGKTVGISGLGNADHILALYLLEQAHADPKKVRFATLGTNIFDVLRLGQVDAAMVQEPALTLIVQAGGGVLVNAMDINDANRMLGGPYEFMGVAVRADELEKRKDEMQRLVRALSKGLHDTRTIPVMEIVAALPKELVAGGDRPQLIAILEKYRTSLYPDTVKIDRAAAERVAEAHRIAGVAKKPADLNTLLDTSVANL